MLKPGEGPPLGFSAFSIFTVLGGLMLLVGANHAAPGCTGPEVVRCDYVATAKAAVAGTDYHPFTSNIGFEVFDQGSSVLVQQANPFGPGWLSHATSVLIDKKSCRTCRVGYSYPEPVPPYDAERGPIIQRVPPEDPIAAAELLEEIREVEASWR